MARANGLPPLLTVVSLLEADRNLLTVMPDELHGYALPPNVHVADLIPAHRLGGLVDAAVFHGGQGTVQTACATGVPFAGMGLQPEQVWNVAVCAARGNAIALSPRDAGTPKLSDAVRRLLEEDSFRRTAAEVAREYEAEDRAAASARLIEETLGG
ncbi:MAG: hypothetical protein R2722_03160 [Tessaracoccus sp.]